MSGTIWYTSDLHIGHRLVAGLRGFGDDTAAHDAELARRWDFLVQPGDIVKVLGDLCVGRGRPQDAALEWIAQRPGIKDLVLGNHDAGHPMHSEAHRAQAGYLDVFRSAQQTAVHKIAGHRVWMSHFPFAADHVADPRYVEWRPPNIGQWLIHGHTHSSVKVVGRQIHVGLDAHGLAPVPRRWVEGVIRSEAVPHEDA